MERAKRGRVLQVRMHESGYEAVQEIAEEMGVTTSEAVRRLLAEALKARRVHTVTGRDV